MLQQYTELLYLPAAGIEIVAPPTGRGAGRHRGRLTPCRGGSRWRSSSTTTNPSATSAGSSRRSTSRRTRRCSPRSNAIPASASRCTTPGHCSTGYSPSDRTPSSAQGTRGARPGRDPRRRVLRARARVAARARSDRTVATDGGRARVIFGTAAARRMARRTRLGAGPADASLVAAGYDWTILDDAHFRAATVAEDDLWGLYTTEDQGQRLRRVRHGAGPRYRIPFARSMRSSTTCAPATDDGERLGMMGDDGEKFGGWPTTWSTAGASVAGSSGSSRPSRRTPTGCTTTTPSAARRPPTPIGRVYVPTGSYMEMGEWALPPDESLRSRKRCTRHRMSTYRRRAGCAARSGATSRSIPRGQRPAQADAGRLRSRRGDAGGCSS